MPRETGEGCAALGRVPMRHAREGPAAPGRDAPRQGGSCRAREGRAAPGGPRREGRAVPGTPGMPREHLDDQSRQAQQIVNA
jgi:hypothetical protein